MPVTIYDDGSLYGDADAIYGRISSELASAQAAHVRETGLIVQVVDERLNAWELFADGDTIPWNYRDHNDGAPIYTLPYYSYRATAGICKLDNGNIIRVRNGDSADVDDRQIWIQTITDATNVSQWNTWSVLYSGTHYSVSIVPTSASTYAVYHSKSDGIYRNNVKMWEPSEGSATRFHPVGSSHPNAGWVMVIRHDVTSDPTVTRTIDSYYTSDITSVTPTADRTNFRWFRNSISAVEMDDGRIGKIQITPLFFSPRSEGAGYAVFGQFRTSYTNSNTTPPYIIRGIGGGGGKNWYGGGHIDRLSDGFYYLVLSEAHQVAKGIAPTTDIGTIMAWSRSKDLLHWSEPVVGPSGNKFAGMVEDGDYVYWAGNDAVYRRPVAVTYDITDYVPEVGIEMPRDNQASTGTVTVANPLNVNNFLRDLADQAITIQAGIKIPSSGQYEYAQFDRFWVKQVNQTVEGQKNRLTLTIGNVLDRLENELKDVYNYVGVTEWEDWKPGKRNQPFNYFFNTDTRPSVDDNSRLKTRGIVLWTGWKGLNFDVTARFSSITGDMGFIGRYIDKRNYIRLRRSGSTLSLIEVVDNVSTTVDSWGVSTGAFTLRWIQEFNHYRVFFNGVEEGSGDYEFDNYKPGYVGFQATSYKVANFVFKDLEHPLTTADLIRTALGLGDVHDVIVSGGTSKAYAIIWGPQTDIPTAADGLKTAMETDKLQMIWRNGSVEVGKFNDTSIVHTIQDRIIESERADEPNRRINYAIVDGNEHSWIALDMPDTFRRGRSVVDYEDLPELLTQEDVKNRAREMIKKSTLGASPGGTTPLYFDIHRMDHVLWIDNSGNEDIVRVEGISIEINQSTTPSQRMTFDNSLIADDPTEIVIEEVIPEETQPLPEDPE